jgi:L-amino acid N-acyltransferase YncA
MAVSTFGLTFGVGTDRYPASGVLDGRAIRLRVMGAADRERVLAFARALPAHDLVFLRRDITRDDQVADWIGSIQSGDMTTLLLLDEAERVLGYGTVDRSTLPWSRHVAELRVLVAPEARGHGVGRLLTEEAFRIALLSGIEKVVAQMTPDQKQAIAVFRTLGFQPEALLRQHVQDRDGTRHDLVVLAQDVARFAATLDAYGVGAALES